MADPTEVDESDTDEEGAPARKNWRKELTGRAEQAEAKAAELERKLALSEAGLAGLSDKQVKALLATHEGEVSAAGFMATAKDLGFKVEVVEGTDADPEQAQRDAEVAEVSRFSGAEAPSGGGSGTSQAEINAKINAFDTPEALRDYVLANSELFGVGEG